jgi:hypothetical protein
MSRSATENAGPLAGSPSLRAPEREFNKAPVAPRAGTTFAQMFDFVWVVLFVGMIWFVTGVWRH